MGKKCKCPPEGAPEWVVTYGDMMSLLLTFFILLVAMSEIKQEDQWRALVQEMKRAFGRDDGGVKGATQIVKLDLVQKLSKQAINTAHHQKVAVAEDPSVEGRQMRVTQIRVGRRFVIGGSITFEPGSAELSKEAKEQLVGVADTLRGYRNKIELQGHAASLELANNNAFNDLWAMSYARAAAVMKYLIEEQGIRAECLRLVANAEQEPLRQRVYDSPGQRPNRRVEIVVTEALVEQYRKPVGTGDELQ